MIIQDKSRFYLVYPSWAKHAWKWEELDAAFRDPLVTGGLGLDQRDYFEKLGYQAAPDSYELISGPVGNGIIRGITSCEFWGHAKLYWLAVLIHGKHRDGADFSTLPDFGVHSEYDVRWLEEKHTGEHQLGLKEPFPTFLPKITLDHAECPDSVVYVSLAFRALSSGNVDDEACLRFQMRCQVFGLKCRPIDPATEFLPETTKAMVSPKINHRWYVVERGQDDLGLFVAKMFYLACAAKQEANKLFQFIHLVGAFEGTPTMSRVLRYNTGVRVYGQSQKSA
jgi:hypothetical protein